MCRWYVCVCLEMYFIHLWSTSDIEERKQHWGVTQKLHTRTHTHARPHKHRQTHTQAYKRGFGAIFVGVNGEQYFLSWSLSRSSVLCDLKSECFLLMCSQIPCVFHRALPCGSWSLPAYTLGFITSCSLSQDLIVAPWAPSFRLAWWPIQDEDVQHGSCGQERFHFLLPEG